MTDIKKVTPKIFSVERRLKKFRKLRQNPGKFILDAKLLRHAESFLSTSDSPATIRSLRKLRKLQEDPSKFFKDSALRNSVGRFVNWFLDERGAPQQTGGSKSAAAQTASSPQHNMDMVFEFHRLEHFARSQPSPELVSIVMPLTEPRVQARSIRSVLAQTHDTWELVVGDDGRADTRYLLEELSDEDRVVVVQVQLSDSPAAVRNKCLARASGSWIAYLDGDRQWEPSFLAIMLAATGQAPEFRMAYAASFAHEIERRTPIKLQGFDRQRLLHDRFIELSNFMHRRQCYEESGGFDERLRSLESWDLVVNYTTSDAPLQVTLPLVNVLPVADAKQDPDDLRVDEYLVASKAAGQATSTAQVFMWPDYRVTNPYQTQLYSEFLAKGLSVTAMGLGEVVEILERGGPQSLVIYHLHWTTPIIAGTSGGDEANERAASFVSLIDRFLELGGKLVWTIHNVTPHDVKHRDVETDLRAKIASRAHCILLHTESVIEAVSTEYPLPAERIKVMAHGNYIGTYDNTIDRGDARRKLGIPDDAIVLLHLGQIRPYKGIEDLVEAFKELGAGNPKLHLVIAGKPVHPMQPSILIEATAGLANVTLAQELIPDAGLQDYLNVADFMVLPYRKVLTSGSALLSLSYSLPLVAPRLGALESLVQHGTSGLLYDPERDDALLETLKEAVAIPPDKRRAMSLAAYARAEEFDWEAISGELATSFLDLADSSSSQIQMAGLEQKTIEIESESVVCDVRPGLKSARKRVAVVILNYQGFADTCAAADSVERSTCDDYHLYIVDNASDDSSFVQLQSLYPNATLIRTPRNLGYAGGNNVGIRLGLESASELVWLLNPDTRIPPTLLEQLVEAAEQHGDIDIFGSRIFLGHGTERVWYGGGVVKWDRGLEASHLNHGEPDYRSLRKPYVVDYVTGASIFFRSAVTEKIGLLPEDYFLYFEETDWCIQAARAGLGVKVVPTTYLFHDKRSESDGLPRPYYLYYYVRNRLLMCNKFEPNKLEETLGLRHDFIDPWLSRIKKRKPSYLPAAERLVKAAIEDGLANRRGSRDLTPLIEGS